MKLIILTFFISFATLAQTPEAILKTSLKSEVECAPEVPKINHCENFHKASCEQRDFAFDGTAELREKKEVEKRFEEARKNAMASLAKKMALTYKQKFGQKDWEEYSRSLGKSECVKWPVSPECLSSVSELHAQRVIVSATSAKPVGHFTNRSLASEKDESLTKLGLEDFVEEQKKTLLETVRFKKDEDKMFAMVDEIKDRIKEKIFKMVPDASRRAELFAKLDSTKFKGFACNDNDQLQSYDKYGAFNEKNDDGTRDITYCAGNFKNTGSSFNLAYLLAHEFSHSIDPCSFRPKDQSKMDREFLEKQHPFAHVLSCLRSPDSVGADWSEDFYKEDLPNFTLCVEDQIGESFSDWMAAEIVPDYMKKAHPELTAENYKQGFMNISRTLSCETKINIEGNVSSHPAPGKRINSIMLANPEIKKLVGCEVEPKGPVHCNENTDVASLRKPAGKSKKPGFKIPAMMEKKSSVDDHQGCFTQH